MEKALGIQTWRFLAVRPVLTTAPSLLSVLGIRIIRSGGIYATIDPREEDLHRGQMECHWTSILCQRVQFRICWIKQQVIFTCIPSYLWLTDLFPCASKSDSLLAGFWWIIYDTLVSVHKAVSSSQTLAGVGSDRGLVCHLHALRNWLAFRLSGGVLLTLYGVLWTTFFEQQYQFASDVIGITQEFDFLACM